VREAILANSARILGLPFADPRVEETARAMLSSHSRLWIDLLRFATLETSKVRALVSRHEGTEHLIEAHSAGRGAVLLTAHVGNFELGGLFLKELGIEVAAVYAPDPSAAVERHRARARAEMGVRGIPVTSSPLSFVAVIRALEANAFVAIQGDRDYSGTGMRIPFFGEATSFPIGPFKIAAAAGSPLLPVFVLQEPDGRYRTVVEPPIHVSEPARRADREAGIREALSRFVAILERTIRENPAQFYRFTPLAAGEVPQP
jgi:KDO2-lipid IV(A) lauroyltransferase